MPPSWTTLYELSKFEPSELKHALGNHWVRPEITREDVPKLHRRVRVALGIQRRPARRSRNPEKPPAFTTRLRRELGDDFSRLDTLDDAKFAEVVAVVRSIIARQAAK